MDLKEQLEQRRKEREVEAALKKGGKAGEMEAYLLARNSFSKKSKDEKDLLINDALSVINFPADPDANKSQKLSQKEAENIIKFGASAATEWWGSAVMVGGFVFGIYLGFTKSGTLGFLVAFGAFFLGLLLNIVLPKLKAAEMLETHRRKVSATTPLESHEVGTVDTKAEG